MPDNHKGGFKTAMPDAYNAHVKACLEWCYPCDLPCGLDGYSRGGAWALEIAAEVASKGRRFNRVASVTSYMLEWNGEA